MSIETVRKKVSLRSSQPGASTGIEEKVDEIINCHTEVFRRGKSLGKNVLPNSNQTDGKKPSFFFVTNKKKRFHFKNNRRKKRKHL